MTRTDSVLAVLVLGALLIGTVGTAAGSTPGYAVYKVQLSFMGVSHAVTVNESVATTSNSSYDRLILAVVSGSSDFNYSRSINSSLQVSPFLPSFTSQSLNYSSRGTSVSLSIAANGTVPITFDGGNYKLTIYALSVTVNSNGTTATVSGALSTFPSGLIYSVDLSSPLPSFNSTYGLGLLVPGETGLPPSAGLPAGTITISAALLSTSLPLSGPSSSAAEQVASVGIGAGAVVSVLALGLGVRYRHRHQNDDKPRPEYSVD